MNNSDKVKPKWDIREYQDGDEKKVLELRKATLGKPKDLLWWKWMYRNGPDGPVIFWLAYDKQKVIGINPGLPLRIKIGEQICKSLLGFDIMTHPDYQGKGVLGSLALVGTKYRLENGYCIDHGTSTPQKYWIYRKLKISHLVSAVCQPPLMVKVFDWGRVLKTRYKIPAFIGNIYGYFRKSTTGGTPSSQNNDIKVEQIYSFDESMDKLWSKASEIKKIMIVRDMKYLNWRYVEKPGEEYKLFLAKRQQEVVGYLVLKFEINDITRGYIVDLLTLPGEDIFAEALIAKAIEYSQDENAATMSCLMLPDTPYYRILKRLGFMHRRSFIQLNVRVFDPNLSGEFVGDSGNWYFAFGDTDTI